MGIVRKVDELGRVVIPVELRRLLGVDVKDPLEIFVDGEYIVLKKYTPGCHFCGNKDVKRTHYEMRICGTCIASLSG